MQVTSEISELRRARAAQPGTFGLVPTMGALHEGHLSLVRHAAAECDHVGVSIFVNPAQFGASEDLDRYPRNLEKDLEVLAPLGVHLVWIPSAGSVYPPGYQTWISVEEVSKGLEGASRPGHFRGVATIVAKLLNVFMPDKAYFGQKDAQQLVVIKRMAADLSFPVKIEVCPTVREPDGLALSSRNAYLSPGERQAATVLFRALSAGKTAYDLGERDGRALRAAMQSILDAEPLARVDYLSAADPVSLMEVERTDGGILLSLAVRLGRTRLIDNILLAPGGVHAARD